MTATFRSTPECSPFRSRTRIMPPKNNGPNTVPIQNHLVLTRSTNSRRTTARILRMSHRLCLRGIRTDEAHEDRVERGGSELEARQPRPGTHQGFEHILSIRAVRQLDLRIGPEVLQTRDQPTVGEHCVRSSLAPVERDDQMPPAVG